MNKRTPFSFMNCLLVTLSSVGLMTNALAAPQPSKSPRAVSVYTDTVEHHQVAQSISLIGKLQADEYVSIASEVTAKVADIKVKANQKVEAGELLVQLEDSKSRAALLEAQAYLNDEQRKLNEYSALVKSNAITQTEVLAQTALVEIGKARLDAAKANLEDHYLRAPFAGTVGLIDFSRGKMVVSGAELLTLDDLTAMDLDLQVPERYLSQLSTGMPVTAESQAWGDITFNGNIVAIDSRINPDTLNLRIRVQFDNPKGQLKPGMMMSSNITFPAINEPIIPVQALEYAGTKRFVYVVGDDNRVKRTQVILGARIKNEVLIESGLELGDRVVVQGLVNMRDGLLVKDLTQQERK